MMSVIKEVCVESFDEAMRAVKAGATRIELCENLTVGGTTPSYGTIKHCLKKLGVSVMVMIRPRGGDFVYTDDELDIMKEDIAICKKLGADGVVFGLLKSDNTINIEKTSALIELSKPMQITFHKAIDETADPVYSAAQLKKLGVDRILSSGGKPTAMEGAETLRQMIKTGGNEMKIIVAGKVTFENFYEVMNEIPSSDYHGRRLANFL
jgi:copper homeostasis protein